MAAQAGQLELNAFLPLIAHHLLGNIQMLTRCVTMFDDLCIRGIEANEERCKQLLDTSLATASALVPYVGYDQATQAARYAYHKGISIDQAAVELGMVSRKDCENIFDAQRMTQPLQKKISSEKT